MGSKDLNKPCRRETCFQLAHGVGFWNDRTGRPGVSARPNDECRGHYLETFGAELVRFEVTAPVEISDVRTGEAVGRGGIVELDPVETNVAMLIAAGFGRVVVDAKPAEDKPAGKAAKG